MRCSRTLPISLVLMGSLAACGETIGEQALIGTAAGAGTAAVVGGSVLTGAALGAAGNVAYCQITQQNCRGILR